MSFSENDFPGLITQIEIALDRYNNPEFSLEVIRKIVNIFKQVPLYPGIASMEAGKMVLEIKSEEVKVKDKILVEFKNQTNFFGTVEETSGDSFKVSGQKFHKDEIARILTIDEHILEKDWPTLVFPEVK